MTIKITTPLITLEVNDEVTVVTGYIKRDIPTIEKSLQAAINEAIKLHDSVAIKSNI